MTSRLRPVPADVAAQLCAASAHLEAGEFDRRVLDIERTRGRWDERDQRAPGRL